MRRSRLVATKLKCGALSRTRLGATKLKCGAGRWAPRQAGNVLTLGGLVSGKELRVAAIVSEDAGGTDPDEVDESRGVQRRGRRLCAKGAKRRRTSCAPAPAQLDWHGCFEVICAGCAAQALGVPA